ncbi:hypothetical protein [Fusobacterium sp.]|uniref:hypothetical protein n=1 Tax=Fusobacterium sp. TaxID=68766 RepID=UPI00396C5C84
MTSPKDRVRANIYKQLLAEEKSKGKKRGLFSISLFVLGMFTSSTYQMITRDNPLERATNYAVATAITQADKKKNDLSIDHFFDNNLFDDKKVEINTDELFGLDRQI